MSPSAVRQPIRLAVLYAVCGDVRFISHRDELRAWERTLARCNWPVVYSQGFSPFPRMRLVLPRSVGMASECQLITIDLVSPLELSAVRDDLQRFLPPGFEFRDAGWLALRPLIHPVHVRYAMSLDAREGADLGARICGEGRVALRVTRSFGARTAEIDLAPFVSDLRVADNELSLTLNFDGQTSARPADLLTALGFSGVADVHRLRRIEATWNLFWTRVACGPDASWEGKSFGNQEDVQDHQARSTKEVSGAA